MVASIIQLCQAFATIYHRFTQTNYENMYNDLSLKLSVGDMGL